MLLLEQCETIDSETLKVSKLHLVKRMTSLKSDFDTHFKCLLEKLNSLMGEILNKALGENPQKKEQDKFHSYWMELQLEIAEKIGNLTKFQNQLNSRCNMIQIKVEYADLSRPSMPQGPPGSAP